jgi:hypothetical protein
MLQHLLAHEILGLPTGWVQRGLSFLLSCAGMATSLFVGFVQLLEGSHPVQPPPFFLAFWFFFFLRKLRSFFPRFSWSPFTTTTTTTTTTQTDKSPISRKLVSGCFVFVRVVAFYLILIYQSYLIALFSLMAEKKFKSLVAVKNLNVAPNHWKTLVPPLPLSTTCLIRCTNVSTP